MKLVQKTTTLAVAAFLPLILAACDGGSSKPSNSDGIEPTIGDEGAAVAPDSDHIAIPAAVRSNLGITFVKVERRRVEHTLRVPGRFEYLPTARREYRTAIPGRVELLVEQFDRVEKGQPLYRLDSPAWRDMQQRFVTAESQIERLQTRIATFAPLLLAHQQHEDSLHESVAVWAARAEQLQLLREAGGGRVEELAQARASLASTRADLASVLEKKAELQAEKQQSQADLRAAKSQLDYLLDAAASVVSRSRAELAAPVETATATAQVGRECFLRGADRIFASNRRNPLWQSRWCLTMRLGSHWQPASASWPEPSRARSAPGAAMRCSTRVGELPK